MNEIWELFIQARTSKITHPKEDEKKLIDRYLDEFNQSYSLTIDQKETMEQLLYLLFNQKKSIYDFYPFLAFLFPMEHIEKSKQVFNELLPFFSTKTILSQTQRILDCAKENEISSDIIHYVTKYPHSKESYIWALGFSYLYNELPTFVPSYRHKFLFLYRNFFKKQEVKLPKNWFLIEDADLLKTYEHIVDEMNENSFLRLAFLLSFVEPPKNLSSFIQSLERLYEEIISLFTQLYDYVNLQKENTHAKN